MRDESSSCWADAGSAPSRAGGAPTDRVASRRVPVRQNRERVSPIDEVYAAEFETLKNFVLKRVGDEEDAVDIVQGVFLRVAARYQSKPLDELKAILFKAAHNASIDYLTLEDTKRRRTALNIDEVGAFIPCGRSLSPERQVLDRERLDIARKALAGLKPRRRTILLMHRMDGLEYAEIASRMNVSISTVTREISQAIAAIKKKLP